MQTISRSLLLVALVATAGIGCASAPTPGTRPASGARDLITSAQLRERNDPNLLEAVRQLRPAWLRMRGGESFDEVGGVVVYMDNVRLGDVTTLRTIQPATVQWIRFYDGLTATSRWGTDHGNGVIFVSTNP